MHFFFFNDTAPTEIYTLSLHDALPILIAMPAYPQEGAQRAGHIPTAQNIPWAQNAKEDGTFKAPEDRSEEHTSELQSRRDLVCRLLLEKKKRKSILHIHLSHYIFDGVS